MWIGSIFWYCQGQSKNFLMCWTFFQNFCICRDLLLLLWWLQLFLDHHSKRRFLQLKSPNITHQAWTTWLLTMWICPTDPEWLSGKNYKFLRISFWWRKRIFKLTVAKFCSILYCSKVQYSPTLWKTVHLLSDLCSQLFLKVSSILLLCIILKLAKL